MTYFESLIIDLLTEDASLHVKHQHHESLNQWLKRYNTCCQEACVVQPHSGLGCQHLEYQTLGAWKHQTRDGNHLHKLMNDLYDMMLYHLHR